MRQTFPSSILLSYGIMNVKQFAMTERAIEYCAKTGGSFWLDSGAFQAYSRGKTIDLLEFADFVRRCKEVSAAAVKRHGVSKFGEPALRVFQLDVIGDHSKSEHNWDRLNDLGIETIPIWTRGAPMEQLKRYEQHAAIIGIGGVAKTRGNVGVVARLVQALPEATRRKCHLLGFGREAIVRAFKPYSFDSSSMCSGERWGSIKLRGDKLGKVARRQLTTQESIRLNRYLQVLGLTYDQFVANARGNHSTNTVTKVGYLAGLEEQALWWHTIHSRYVAVLLTIDQITALAELYDLLMEGRAS